MSCRTVLVLGLVLVLAACGNNQAASTSASAPTSVSLAAEPTEPAPAAIVVAPPPPPPELQAPPPREEVVTRATRPGVTTRALLVRPPRSPTHAIVLLAGGSGKLGLSAVGLGPNAQDNFLVRTREQFVEAGFVVAVVDAPSDRSEGLEGFRGSREHAEDLGELVASLREQYRVPVWLIGTSRGTISAANAAARLGSVGPDGLVLLSSITAGRHETLSELPLTAIAVPTLVVQNRGDACSGSPPGGARALIRALRRAPIHRLLMVGRAAAGREADPCEALTQHGYVGIEREVVDAVIGFVKHPV